MIDRIFFNNCLLKILTCINIFGKHLLNNLYNTLSCCKSNNFQLLNQDLTWLQKQSEISIKIILRNFEVNYSPS
jgi:hypothetical protein